MQRGTRTALALALAGLLGAGVTGGTLAQGVTGDEGASATPARPRILILVPYNGPATGAQDTDVEDRAAPSGDAGAQDEAQGGTTEHRMLILVPVPQDDEDEAAPDSDDDDDSDDGTDTSSGNLFILVPRQGPGALPPGVTTA